MELKKFKITYNAPVVLTFCFMAAAIFLLDYFVFEEKALKCFFTAPGHGSAEAVNSALNSGENVTEYFSFSNPLHYFRLIFHVLGHSSPSHLFGNLCYLLLLGPILEKKYGSLKIGMMMLITAVVSGFVNALFIPYPMCGASDIIFMMILLVSYTSIDKTELPLSFIMIFLIYIGKELFAGENEQIATFAHIAGGICGSLFALIFNPASDEEDEETAVDIEEFEEEKPKRGLRKTREKSKAKTKSKSAVKSKAKKEEKKPDDDGATVVGTIEL